MDSGDENLGEDLVKVASLSEIDVGNDRELGFDENNVMNSTIGSVDGSPDRENRSVSPTEAFGDLVGGEFMGESPSATKKGYGLKKKWRRIRRNLNKDETVGGDSAMILKRRLSIPEAPKAREDQKIKSDGEAEAEAEAEVASVDSNVVAPSVLVVAKELDSELGLLAAAGFAVGIDSENSEDRGSKFSTAASAPRLRHEIGFGRDRNRARGTGGRGSAHLAQQRGQRTRGGVDASRRHGGGQSKVEKENSYSSVESDLRSSSTNFAQRASVTSDAKKTEKSVSYDGEHSDDAQPCEEVLSSYHKENGRTVDSSRADLEEHVSVLHENSQTKSDLDPFLASIVSLKAAQEALENEIQKIGEIGKEAMLDDTNSLYEETEGSSSPTSEAHFAELNRKIEQLEFKLEEALATAKIKDSRILELETLLEDAKLSNGEEDPSRVATLQDKCKKLEVGLESMFAEKMEAEVKYMIMTRTTQNWKVQAEDQIALSEEQNILARDLSEFNLKLREAEDKSISLKVKVENLEDEYQELEKGQEVLRSKNKVYKYSLCLVVQMVLFFVALVLVFVQLLPSPIDVVPT